MSDLNVQQARALLDSAARQIAAAQALLGGPVASAPSARETVQRATGVDAGERCPACQEKAPKVSASIANTVQLCGACGYEYPTQD